jgi:hypothetical protein
MIVPRWVHYLYATLTGQGWFACLCGQEFGGHEASGETVTRRDGVTMPICAACTLRRYSRQPPLSGETLDW